MKINTLLGASALLALPLLAQPSPAAQPAQPWEAAAFTLDAAELARAAARVSSPPVSPPPGAGVVVLLRETEVTYDADHRATFREHLIYRVDDADALARWSTVEAAWRPWHQERPEIRARVIGADGEHRLEASAITERSAEDTVGARALSAALPGMAVGAVVEEEIVVRDRLPYCTAGVDGLHRLPMPAPIHRGRLILSAPISLPLRFGVRGLSAAAGIETLEPVREVVDGIVRVRFDVRDLAAARSAEDGLPSQVSRYPHVAWSTGKSWQEVAATLAAEVERTLEADSAWSAQPLAGDAPATAETTVAALHAAVRFNGEPWDADGLSPRPPSETLALGRGDAFDLATLLVAMLRKAGIRASAAWLEAGFGKDVDAGLPGLGRFNHVLVLVSDGRPRWIDPTDPSARVGEIAAAAQGRWALVAEPQTERLRRTVTAQSIDNLLHETRRVVFAEHGAGRVEERIVGHGAPERRLRRRGFVTSADERRRADAADMAARYQAAAVGETRESAATDFSHPFVLERQALGCRRVMTDLEKALAVVDPEDLFLRLPGTLWRSTTPRRGDFEIEEPFVTEISYIFEPPTGFAARELPPSFEREFGPARYRQSFELGDDGTVRAELRLDSGVRRLTPADVEALRAGARELLGGGPLVLRFDHPAAADLAGGSLPEGRLVEVFAELRRLAEGEPDRAIHQVRLAQALLDLGLVDEARRAADRAALLEPGSALAQWMRGVVLEHGPDGERFAEGWDRGAAIEALERAVALDDASAAPTPLARVDLALALEHDAAGRRYGGGGELGKALAVYRELQRRGQNFDPQIWNVLYHARRWPELLDATMQTTLPPGAGRAAEAEPERRVLRLAAAAMLEGPRAALEEAARLTPDTRLQTALLVGAAHRLLSVREYRDAAGLLRRIAGAAPDPDAVLNQAETLARARRHEITRLSDAHPEALVESVLAALARGDLGSVDWQGTELSRLLHRAVRVGEGAAALREVLAALDAHLFAPSGEMPPEVARDLALAALETTVEGEEGLGRRVTAKIGKASARFYISRDDGGEGPLRVVALDWDGADGALWAMGVEVSARLARRDLRGARQWLDWAREALSAGGATPPLVRFWPPQRDASTEDFELAAALLLAGGPTSEMARAELRDVVAASRDQVERGAAEEALRAVEARAAETRAAETRAAETGAPAAPVGGAAFAGRLAEVEAALAGDLGAALEALRRIEMSQALRDYAVARVMARLGFVDRARTLYEELAAVAGEPLAGRVREQARKLPRRDS